MNSIRPYLKAFVPLVLGVVTVLVQWVVTGTLDHVELNTAIAALVTAVMVWLVPNRPAV